jgi:hypothetical protein
MTISSTVGRTFALTVVVGLSFISHPDRSRAQVEIRSRAMRLTATGRIHTQYNTTSVPGELATQFIVRRARFVAEVKVNDVVDGKVEPDFGEGKIDLKDAYVRFNLAPALRLKFGQFKRPFDIFQLHSSTETLIIERAGDIRGVSTCAGPGGLCTFSRFSERLKYADRDVGVMVDGTSASGKVSYAVSMTNGAGRNTGDENGTKSYSGRVELQPTGRIRLGGHLGIHDYVNDVTTDDDYAVAAGADIEVGDFDAGVHLHAGVLAGQNWQNLDATGDPSTFATAQIALAYKQPLANSEVVEAIQPLGRVSWGDPDSDGADDAGWLFTPGLVLFVSGRNKIAANVDIWVPALGSTEWSFKMQSYLHF